MTIAKGFLQMYSISGVGGGSLDFHLDTHSLMRDTDYGRQEEARNDSRDGSSQASRDNDGSIHVYQNGSELC